MRAVGILGHCRNHFQHHLRLAARRAQIQYHRVHAARHRRLQCPAQKNQLGLIEFASSRMGTTKPCGRGSPGATEFGAMNESVVNVIWGAPNLGRSVLFAAGGADDAGGAAGTGEAAPVWARAIITPPARIIPIAAIFARERHDLELHIPRKFCTAAILPPTAEKASPATVGKRLPFRAKSPQVKPHEDPEGRPILVHHFRPGHNRHLRCDSCARSDSNQFILRTEPSFAGCLPSRTRKRRPCHFPPISLPS